MPVILAEVEVSSFRVMVFFIQCNANFLLHHSVIHYTESHDHRVDNNFSILLIFQINEEFFALTPTSASAVIYSRLLLKTNLMVQTNT